jgi:hypothetical protein
MRRFAAFGLIVFLAVSWAGCGGGSGTITQLPVVPPSMSLHWGEVQQLTATAENSSGTAITTAITYTSSNPAVADVSSTGVVCGGQWDSETTAVVCNVGGSNSGNSPTRGTSTPPSPLPCTAPCTAVITASVQNGPSNSINVLVHPGVASVKVARTDGGTSCVTQTGTATFTVTACSTASNCTPGSATDITSQVFDDALSPGVDPFIWAVVPSAVGTTSCTTGNTCTVTAATPGQAQVIASFNSAPTSGTSNSVSSQPVPFTTCPIQSLSLQATSNPSSGATSASLASGTEALTVNAIDSTGTTLSSPPIQLNTSQPATATVTNSAGSGTATVVAAGTSTVTASCTPPNCNIGMYPVYSNLFTLSVPGTSSTTVYAASNSGTSLLPIDATSGTAAAAITLPATPNSMVFAPNGTSLYLGSGGGLMVVTTSNNTVANNAGAPGTVLAVSPDSSTVLTATSGNVYVFASSNSAVKPLPVAGAVAAAFSPDSNRAYIVTSSGLVVYTTATGGISNLSIGNSNKCAQTTPLAGACVDFLAQGSFAYLAGGPDTVSVLATCNNSPVTGAVTSPPATAPTLIRSLPNATHVLTANSPNIDDITVTETGTVGSTALAGTTCIPPSVTNANASHPIPGVSAFTPSQLIVTPDSSKAYILSDNASLLVYDVASATPLTITITGATGLTTGGVTLDSTNLFVGVLGTNTIHKITVSSGVDNGVFATPGFEPDFVAVRPK